MCGLVGVIVAKSATTGNQHALEGLVGALLNFSTVRGRDSTGVVSAKMRDGHLGAAYAKEIVPGTLFTQTKIYGKLANTFGNATAIMGHTRYGTMGGQTREAAHPHITNDIVLCHNGTLTKFDNLQTSTGGMNDLDSARIAYEMQHHGSVANTLENLHGAYALTWLDSRTGSMYIARNSERPLWWTVLNSKYLVYASSPWMIEGAMEISKLDNDLPIEEVKTEKLWDINLQEFDIKKSYDKGKGRTEIVGVTKTDFKDSSYVQNYPTYQSYGSAYSKNIDYSHNTVKSFPAGTEKSNQHLSAVNLAVGTVVEVFVDSCFYKNKEHKNGVGFACTASKPTVPVVLVNVSEKNIDDTAYSYDAKILGATNISGCLKVYATLQGVNRLEVDAHQYSKVACGDKKFGPILQKLFGSYFAAPKKVSKDLVKLPSGLALTDQMYKKLIGSGCSICTGVLNEGAITWHNEVEPLCEKCATNTDSFLEYPAREYDNFYEVG